MSNMNVDIWKTVIDNISRSAEIKGSVKAITEIVDILNNKAIESKNNEAVTLESVVAEVTQYALLNGFSLVQEKITLDKKIETDIMILVSSNS